MIHLWYVSFGKIEFPTFYILATRMYNHVKNEGYALPDVSEAEVIQVGGKNKHPQNVQNAGIQQNFQNNEIEKLAQQEDDDLALALKLSMQEQENVEKKARTSTQVKLEDYQKFKIHKLHQFQHTLTFRY